MTLIKRALGRPDLITAEIERINNMGKGFDNILDMPVGSDEKDIIMENDLPEYDIMNEEIDVDDYMTTIVRNIDKTGKILIAVNIEINRLSIPYFKVYIMIFLQRDE